MRRWLLCALLVPLLFLSCDAGGGDDDGDGDATPYAFTDLYTLMSETTALISETAYYGNPAYDPAGYVFVQSGSNSISVFAAVGLTKMGSFDIDPDFTGPDYSLNILSMKCANNRLYVSTLNKIFVFDTTDPVPFDDPYSIQADGTETSFSNIEIVGNYVYVACQGGLSIFKDTGSTLVRTKTILPAGIGEASLSFKDAKLVARNDLLYVFAFKDALPPFDKYLVLNVSDRENPAKTVSQTDSHFRHKSVRLFSDHFVSTTSAGISIFKIASDGTLVNTYDADQYTAGRVYEAGDKLFLEEKNVFNVTSETNPVLLFNLQATLKYNHFVQPKEKDLYFVHIIKTDDKGTPNNTGDDISACSLAHYSLLK